MRIERLGIKVNLGNWKGCGIAGLISFAIAWAPSAQACDVPVFRYALDFWPASAYRLAVVHRGPLSQAEQKTVKDLQAGFSQDGSSPNLDVRLADLSDSSNAPYEKLWQDAGKPALPAMILLYPPETGIEQPVWTGALSEKDGRSVLDSPARKTIAQRILKGHSAVFVVLASGDAAKDAAVKSLLETQFKDLERSLELPVPPEELSTNPMDPDADYGPPLQIRFSVLTVSRDDPAEAVFIQTLLHAEPDLLELRSEPIVFPVFGRARALFALVGKGINEDNVAEACMFLTGACSCQVKEMNPGVDLLMPIDWDAQLEAIAQQAYEKAAKQSAELNAEQAEEPDPERGAEPVAGQAAQKEIATPASAPLRVLASAAPTTSTTALARAKSLGVPRSYRPAAVQPAASKLVNRFALSVAVALGLVVLVNVVFFVFLFRKAARERR